MTRMLSELNVPATLFTTTAFSERYRDAIPKLSLNHEVAFHGYAHLDDYRAMGEEEIADRLREGKRKLEEIAQKRILGFRAQRFQEVQPNILNRVGVVYDSSVHPTFLPGRYNNFFAGRHIRKHHGLIEIPLSVTPLLRLPLFWMAFRNFGLAYSKLCTELCFLDAPYVMLLFHPWEFADLTRYDFGLPRYVKRNAGFKLVAMISRYVRWCKQRGYRFSTIKDFLFGAEYR